MMAEVEALGASVVAAVVAPLGDRLVALGVRPKGQFAAECGLAFCTRERTYGEISRF